MTTNEMYYLILVCAAFLALGLGLAVQTFAYHRSLARSAKHSSRK